MSMGMMRWFYTTVLLFAMNTSSFAGVVRLGWSHDGIGHKGFRLYYGKTSHAAVKSPHAVAPDSAPYESIVNIMDPTARQYEMVLPEGRYYFRLTAIGEQIDSGFTAEEPMAAVGVNTPSDFKVEWILTTPK